MRLGPGRERNRPCARRCPLMSARQRVAVAMLRYGYGWYVPGAWINAILLLGPDEKWPAPRGTVWDAIGPRARRRLARRGFTREQY